MIYFGALWGYCKPVVDAMLQFFPVKFILFTIKVKGLGAKCHLTSEMTDKYVKNITKFYKTLNLPRRCLYVVLVGSSILITYM